MFGGETFQPEEDTGRLLMQLMRVYRLMSDGQWRTLYDISQATGDPSQSVSARLRDLRKDKFGGYTVDRKRVSKGTFVYRVADAKPDATPFLLTLFA